MSDHMHEYPELEETELEEQDGEALPDREVMSRIGVGEPTPFIDSPEITLPVEPPGGA